MRAVEVDYPVSRAASALAASEQERSMPAVERNDPYQSFRFLVEIRWTDSVEVFRGLRPAGRDGA